MYSLLAVIFLVVITSSFEHSSFKPCPKVTEPLVLFMGHCGMLVYVGLAPWNLSILAGLCIFTCWSIGGNCMSPSLPQVLNQECLWIQRLVGKTTSV